MDALWPLSMQESIIVDASIGVIRDAGDYVSVSIYCANDGSWTTGGSSARLLALPAGDIDLDAELVRGRTFARTVNRRWIDRDLLRGWKSKCHIEHQETCGRAIINTSLSTQRPTWLLDVVGGCICRATPVQAYVVLSYVWSTKDFLKTTKGNLETMQKRGTLDPLMSQYRIPRTIRDAMTVVKSVSMRYLWVDVLCIVQDDTKEKQIEIAKMAGIYANASLVIIAAGGNCASSGLGGISTLRRYPHPRVAVRNSKKYILESPPEIIGDVKTSWYNRG